MPTFHLYGDTVSPVVVLGELPCDDDSDEETRVSGWQIVARVLAAEVKELQGSAADFDLRKPIDQTMQRLVNLVLDITGEHDAG